MATVAQKSPLPWRTREEIANITLHSFGLILGLIGFGVLISVATLSGSIERIVSSSIYAVTVMLVYLASVLFHTSLAMESRWQKAFEVVDHCAIFLLIAGTYTPFLMVTLKGQQLGWKLPKVVIVPHENMGVAMAHGYTMITGKPQAMMVHVGVGTANAINGLINASRQNLPILFTAGRTPIRATTKCRSV